MMEEKDVRTIVEIAKRAEEKGILASDRLSLIMDLKCVHDEVGLRLEGLLEADSFNFAHDIIGIQNNIDRSKKELANHFLPRYTDIKLYKEDSK